MQRDILYRGLCNLFQGLRACAHYQFIYIILLFLWLLLILNMNTRSTRSISCGTLLVAPTVKHWEHTAPSPPFRLLALHSSIITNNGAKFR